MNYERIFELLLALVVTVFSTVIGSVLIILPILLVARGAFYLVTAEWVWSACDILNRISVLSPKWERADPTCSVNTGFLGADKILNFAVNEVDASLGLIIVALMALLTMLGALVVLLYLRGTTRL